MNTLLTGATGFIGRPLTSELRSGRRLVQTLSGRRLLEEEGLRLLDGVQAVVHLAGDNLAQGRWTAAKKRLIRESRVVTTRRLAEACAAAKVKPSVFITASAVGYYGDRGEERLDETGAAGTGFLAEVCREWEEAAAPAAAAGIRTVHLRFGVVLGPGGALAKMRLPFSLGLGGPIGSGRQYMSWISLEDAVAAAAFALEKDSLSGPVNVVAPEAVRNGEFAKALGRALGRPAVLPLPAFAARLALGEMADDALLASQRAVPAKLQSAGFKFRKPDLPEALAAALT